MEICWPFTGKHDKKMWNIKEIRCFPENDLGLVILHGNQAWPSWKQGRTKKQYIYIYSVHTCIYIIIHTHHTYPYIPTYNCIHIEEGTTVYEFVHRGWGLCDTKKCCACELAIYLSIYPSYPILSYPYPIYLSTYLSIYLSVYLYQTSKVFSSNLISRHQWLNCSRP